jgi:hypothetical protein
VGGFEKKSSRRQPDEKSRGTNPPARGPIRSNSARRKTDEVAKIRIVVEHDPLDVHEVSGNGFGAGGPIQIEPLGHTGTDGMGPASVCASDDAAMPFPCRPPHSVSRFRGRMSGIIGPTESRRAYDFFPRNVATRANLLFSCSSSAALQAATSFLIAASHSNEPKA